MAFGVRRCRSGIVQPRLTLIEMRTRNSPRRRPSYPEHPENFAGLHGKDPPIVLSPESRSYPARGDSDRGGFGPLRSASIGRCGLVNGLLFAACRFLTAYRLLFACCRRFVACC
jgi:hypothetical protein